MQIILQSLNKLIYCCNAAGKKKRLTFIECNNDINSMIDLAKVADLVSVACSLVTAVLIKFYYCNIICECRCIIPAFTYVRCAVLMLVSN